uniref:protein FAR1-RELATED SEQUENCE 5-like n=1 Tax=Erigeron canadensis TaxID=72917 RepID=UPI001CB911FB|nr:protein FAR1-RELATED SEQUENCE 5-like [Erigeron canadensis]
MLDNPHDAEPIQNSSNAIHNILEEVEQVEPSHIQPLDGSIHNIPQIGMKFDSEEELYEYYRKYAYQVGFGVSKANVRRKGDTRYYSLQCFKGGVYVYKTESSRPRLSSKTGCKAKVRVIVKSSGKCSISLVLLEHNHVSSPAKSRFQRSHKKMDSYTKRRLELNDHAGIPLHKNFHSLVVEAKGYENLPFDERDCRNYIAKVRQLRLGVGDAEALRNYFVRMQRRSPNFFYVIDIDDESRLRNVFWADARSRAAYESFGDVVTFDSTYLTNKYSMPFAPFIGVNHHGQSILLGCGLISYEDIETYVWLFKCWLEYPQEFEYGWAKMITDYSLEKNDWLSSLYSDRMHWIPVYVRVIFWAGMSTTQRSESMNAFFDGYVNSKTTLRQFVEQYDNALKSKMEKENKADYASLHSSYQLLTRYYFERQFQESYTNAVFKLFQDELRGMLFCNHSLYQTDGTLSLFHVKDIQEGKYEEYKINVVYTVSYNEVGCDIKCSCHLFEFRGIICRHMVKILIEKGINEVPSRYVLCRWRKDVKHRQYFVTNCYDDLKSGEQTQQLDRMCTNFYEAANIVDSPEKYEYLMKCINIAKEKLNDNSIWSVNNNLIEDVASVGAHDPLESASRLVSPKKVSKEKADKPQLQGWPLLSNMSNEQVNSSSVTLTNTTTCIQGTIPVHDNLLASRYSFDLNE